MIKDLAIGALPPSVDALSRRKRPKRMDGPWAWSEWNCYRGARFEGDDGFVALGFVMNPEPIASATAIRFEIANFSVAAAKELAAQLDAAIARAEAC